jgi:hypothetical protein
MTIYFISGHCNISQDEFELHYKLKIDKIILDKTNKFVIGNAWGADTMALEYLLKNNYPANMITIYYLESKNSKSIDYYKSLGVNVIDEFTSYSKRDGQMTMDSDVDIAWIRPQHETEELLKKNCEKFNKSRISGTEKNLLRRKKLIQENKKIYTN